MRFDRLWRPTRTLAKPTDRALFSSATTKTPIGWLERQPRSRNNNSAVREDGRVSRSAPVAVSDGNATVEFLW